MYTAVYKFTDYWNVKSKAFKILEKQFPWYVIKSVSSTWLYLIFQKENKYSLIAECSPETWEKKYKKDINNWISFIRKKDIKKIMKLYKIMDQIETDILTIKSIWKT